MSIAPCSIDNVMKHLFPLFLILIVGLAIHAQTPADCPTLKVTGPDSLTQPGEKMTFTAEVVGAGKSEKLVFEWMVSAGTIVAGQGSATIDVLTTVEMEGSNVTAVARLAGVTGNCKSNNASETASVAAFPIGEPADRFGLLKYRDLLPRIDSFFIGIKNNAGYQGLVHVQVKELGPKERRYLYSIYNAVVALKNDLTKIRFAIERHEQITEPQTTLWTFSSDRQIERIISNSEVIKGTEFKRKLRLTRKPNTK